MYYTMLVIFPKFHGHASSFLGFFNFSFLIKSSIRCILIVKFQKGIKLSLWSQFGHGDACFWTQIPHLTPKPTFPKFKVIIYHLSEIISEKAKSE